MDEKVAREPRPVTGRVPQPVAAAADDLLAGLAPERRELFHLRVERWWPDVREGLAAVHGTEAAARLEVRLLRAAATSYARRDEDLHRLDQARTLAPDWFQRPGMLGYAAYADRFAGTLAGVRDRLPLLEELGVTYLHLMPLLLPREGDSDGGYAVADYRRVRPDLGTTEDLRELATTLRGRGVSLVLDLVLNHVAREHPWAELARRGTPEERARYRGYFHVFGDREGPDAFERTLPEVFPDTSPGSFTWDEELDAWVWTTFNSFQWDLDWSSPEVLAEMVDVVLHLADLGVEVLRLDAVAFLWKRLGTSCQNQPEVHDLVQVLRGVTRVACPGLLLKAEAIVAPDDLVPYLGTGAHAGRVSDLAYHNSLMVQVWSMLATGDVVLATRALQRIPPAPSSTAWITYVRCHDDIGWAVSDEDAAAVGLSGHGHRSFLADWYSGAFPGSPATGLVFQEDPATGDRRTSGATAALTGLEAALARGGRPGDEDVDLAVRRVLLAHAVVLGWGGVPVLWSGDEVGQPGDPGWAGEPGHEADNRWVHRPRASEVLLAERHDPSTVAGTVFAGVRHLARTRASLPHLHAATPAQVLDPSDPGVLVVLRRHPEGDLLLLANVTGSWRPFPGERLDAAGLGGAPDALTGRVPERGGDGALWLSPYDVVWLVGSR
ncbi:amylosucrase [Pseudokineococcus marinus]|uniref:amylosucrase n=1 Tax=Pseudokineococcus marinus TaxID=351215 RepID=UPI001BB2E0CF|nr:amylosucrase [Pseudokineococcus marinus]